MKRGHVAECPRCAAVLHRARSEPSRRSLALTLSGLALFVVAVGAPFLSFDLSGQVRDTTLAGMPSAFEAEGFWELDILVLTTTVLAPGAMLVMTLMLLIGIRLQRPPVWLPRIARWRAILRPWSMTEVFLLGVFVAYSRLAALATVEVGAALYALGGLMLMTIAAEALLDAETLWETLGQRCGLAPVPASGRLIGCDHCGLVSRGRLGSDCPRCGAALRERKPNSLARTWALLIGAALLYIPANVYPILTVVRLGRGEPSTILSGAQELLQVGMWPLALLVFVASIAVPLLKLAALTWMLVASHRRSSRRLRERTILYRVVDAIGRWSMIDVFMMSILTALVQMGILASVVPNIGAVFFAGVVVLTMFAAFSFDPRIMWDRAGQQSAAAAGSAENVTA